MYLKSKKLKIYDVNIEYRNYLREFDDKVNLKEGRRFCGVIVSNNENDYCIPLTSRPYRSNGKKRNTKTTVEIKANKHLIGALLINNMIPVNKHLIKEINTNTDIDKNYLINELNYLNKPRILEEIATKTTKVYENYEKFSFMKDFCCDFKLLEEKCKEWEKTHEKELDHIEHKSERNKTIMESEEIKKLRELAKDKNWRVRIEVAKNSNTPQDVLQELADDEDIDVRKEVAENRSTPPEVLAELAKDEVWIVREGVVGNESTPPEVLTKLAKDEDIDVRKEVAKNESTPPEALEKLVKDEDGAVRVRVAVNKSTPPETLTELAKDEDRYIRAGVARNESTPPEVLTKLAKDEDWRVRGLAAENKNTPAEVLAEVAKDKNWRVRAEVAENKNTPSETLIELAKDEDRIVRENAISNPHYKAIPTQNLSGGIAGAKERATAKLKEKQASHKELARDTHKNEIDK